MRMPNSCQMETKPLCVWIKAGFEIPRLELFWFSRFFVICLLICSFCITRAFGVPSTWICSTDGQFWKAMPSPEIVEAQPDVAPLVRVVSRKTYQTMDGFGGCFNELGWVALGKASQSDRRQVLDALFSDNGCAFTLARLPIGASDFAVDAYSLDDMPGDLTLTNFSITRDQQRLIPFAKAAMEIRPSLQCWGSPWSPPAWMKTNNDYSKGALKWEPPILQSYANYCL